MSGDVIDEIVRLELRLAELRGKAAASGGDLPASETETDEQRRRRIYYGSGDGLRRDDVEGGGENGGLYQPARGKQYGG